MGGEGLRRRLILIMVVIMVFALAPVAAEARTPVTAVDLVLLIDNSGSMRTNDPQLLRWRAARQAVDYLETGDQVGVLLFDSRVEEIFPLSTITGGEARRNLREQIPDLPAQGATDIKGALMTAARQLQEGGRPEARPMIILLTDGLPNPDPNRRYDQDFMAQYLADLENEVDALAAAGVAIYGVGLTEEADMEFLARVGARSGGWSQMVERAEQLSPLFRAVLQEAKQRVSLWEEGERELRAGEEISQSIQVEEYTREVVFTGINLDGGPLELRVTRPGGGVISPQERGVEVSREPGYVSFRVESPAPGRWQILARGEGRLHLLVEADPLFKIWLVSPGSREPLRVGEEAVIRAQATADGEPAGDREVAVTCLITGAGQPSWEMELELVDPARGIYEGKFTPAAPGQHRILLQARRGATTLDSREFPVAAVYPLTLEIASPPPGEYLPGTRVLLQGEISHAGQRVPSAALDSLEGFWVEITGPEGKKWEVELRDDGDRARGDILAGDGLYSVYFEPPEPGEYQYRFRAEGLYQGEGFSLERTLSRFRILPPGRVELGMSSPEVNIRPGRPVRVPVTLLSSYHSDRKVILRPGTGSPFTFTPLEVELPPGEEVREQIQVSVPADLEPGEYHLTLEVVGAGGEVEDRAELLFTCSPPVDILPLVMDALPWAGGGGAALILAGFLADLTVGRRRNHLKGVLFWAHPQATFGQEQEVDLGLEGSPRQELNLGGRVFSVYTLAQVRPAFLRGLLALVSRGPGAAYYLAPYPLKELRSRRLPVEGSIRLYHQVESHLGKFRFWLDNPDARPPLPRKKGRAGAAPEPRFIDRLKKYEGEGPGEGLSQ